MRRPGYEYVKERMVWFFEYGTGRRMRGCGVVGNGPGGRVIKVNVERTEFWKVRFALPQPPSNNQHHHKSRTTDLGALE